MKLEGLQEKLKTYNENNKQIILEEEDSSNANTSNRLRGTSGQLDGTSLSSIRRAINQAGSVAAVEQDGDDKTIIFEKLSRVSSNSKL